MRFPLLAALTWSLALAACGGSVEPPDPQVATPGAPEAPAPPAAQASRPHAIDPRITQVDVDHVFLMARPGCTLPYREFHYDRAARTLSSPECSHDKEWDEPDAGTVIEAPASSRVLTASEAQSVEDILATITYEENPESAGEDGEEYYLVTYDSAGKLVRKYSWRNLNGYGFPTADHLTDLYERLGGLLE